MTNEEFQQQVLERLEKLETILTTGGTHGTLCNLKEAAKIMGVSTKTFRRNWMDTEEIKHRVGKRFLRADVMRLKRRIEGIH